MADQNFRVKRGLEVGVGGTVLTATAAGNIGIGSVNPLAKLDVVGDARFTGIITASSFDGSINSPGKTLYVATNGSDSNTGNNLNEPYATLKYALSVATSGDTIFVQSGTFTEIFPLTVPVGVSVRGAGIRATFIQPTSGTRQNDGFLLNGETTVEDLSIGNFYEPGYGFKFANNAKTTIRSPYIQRVTVLNKGSVTSTSDPYGFDTPHSPPSTYKAGRGALIDGSVVDPTTLEPAMLFNECTFITPNNIALEMTNGARSEWVNCFTYFADKGINAYDGTVGLGSTGSVRIKTSGITTGGSGFPTTNDEIYYLEANSQSATYSQVGTALTITRVGHGLTVGNRIFANITSGIGSTGFYRVTGYVGVNTFSVTTVASATTSGNLTYKQALGFGTVRSYTSSTGLSSITGKGEGLFELPTSRLGKTVTAYGDAQLSTLQKKIGTASLYLDGTGDYARCEGGSDFAFSGNFTAETWIYPTSVTGNRYLFSLGTETTGRYNLFLVAGVVTGNFFGSGSTTFGGSIATNTWTHIALVRSGSTITVYVNGTALGTTETNSSAIGNTGQLTIGADTSGANVFVGYIDEVRISNTARYTGTFTPSTTQFNSDGSDKLLLHLDGASASTSFIDSSIPAQDIRWVRSGVGIATATKITLADYQQFGAEMRSIGSAVVFGNTGISASGPGVGLRLFAFNFGHIGSGKDFSQDVSLVNQAAEVVKTNNANVYFVSIDQSGDFRVGDAFYANQEAGTVNFGGQNFTLNSLSDLNVTDGTNTSTLTPTYLTVGNIQIVNNDITSTSGDININPSGSSATNIDGNLNVSGILTASVLQTGALQIGDTSIAIDDTGSNGTIRFNTDNIEALRITNSQNVGIGTTNATSRLTVSGDTSVSGLTTTNNLYVAGVGTFLSSGLKIRNPANTFQYNITGGAITADRTLNLPLTNTADTLAALNVAQTFTNTQTFGGTLTANAQISLGGAAASNITFGTNQTTATLIVGGTTQTGTMTLGRSTATQQTDIQAGASGVGTTKTINFGTGGLSGSFTQINIGPGPSAGVGTVVINSGTSLLVGSATSTGTVSQPLQVTGGAYVSTALGIGRTNPGNFSLDVNGIARIGGASSGKVVMGSGMAAGEFGLQILPYSDRTELQAEQQGTSYRPLVLQAFGSSVGIGTTIPGEKLHIGQGRIRLDEGWQLTWLSTAGTQRARILGDSASNFLIETGVSNTEALRIDSLQRVGINTNSPVRPLHVNGTVRIADSAAIEWGGTSAYISGTSASNALLFNTSSTERVRIDSVGNIGINSTSPTEKLDVVGNIKLTGAIYGPTELIIDPAAVGDNTGSVRIKGDLYVDGTQTYLNSTTIELADFNVGIASTVGTNLLLDGAGIGIGSTTIRKTITWNNTAGALTSSEDWNLVSGKQYEINGTSVLSSTTLGSGVVNSSLTSVGTLGQLNVSGNLGIGTNNPSSKLHVYGGNLTIENSAPGPLDGPYIDFKETGFNDRFGVFADFGGGGDDNKLHLTANSSGAVPQTSDAKVTLLPSGAFLIGSVNPTGTASQPLQVTGGAYVSGNTGIGETNPQNPLHISGNQGTLLRIDGGAGGTGTRDIVITEFNTTAYGGIIRYDSVQDTFTVGTLENSVVQYALNIARATGNVGVGYSQLNSTVKLAVNGTTLINTNSLTGTASQSLQVTGGAYVSDSVGIGTTNPGYALDVSGVGRFVNSFADVRLLNNYSASAQGYRFALDGSSPNNLYLQRTTNNFSTVSNVLVVDSNNNILINNTSATGTSSQPLQVTGGAYVSGDLGIGKTNPTAKLHVAGSGTINTGTTIAVFNNSSDQARISIVDENATGTKPPGIRSPAASYGLGLYASGGPIRFYPSDVEYARFDGSGNLLLNSTTATGTASQPLQVTGGAYVSGNVGIGLTNPSNRLTVYGTQNDTTPILALLSGNQQGGFNNGAQIAFGYDGTSTYQHFVQTRHNSGNSSNAIDFYVSDGTQNNTLTSGSVHTMSLVSGSVGVGTITPQALLQVGAATTQSFFVTSTGSVGIATTNPQYNLHVIGSFAATTKSFVIDHPTKPGKQLRYASLEGPENGVYVRGRLKGNNTIELPEYWTALVDEESITVNLTPIGRKAPLHSVVDIVDNTVVIESANDIIDCFYTVFGERKDVEKLEVEI